MPAGHVVHTRQAVGSTVTNDLALCIGGGTLIDVFAGADSVPGGRVVFNDIASYCAIAFIRISGLYRVITYVGVTRITNDGRFAEVNAAARSWYDVAIGDAV